ncbi:putative membrane protein [Austwickia chelonae]|uniref:YdbS-like PH domain-containing protein n=1 Tax=Austwickia chelonae NBRC 105200 TaxID=1184607 RepID=K6VR46_9MICO|nr:PH domain-containing protein [Austwickia chelonae]GAB79224.1 hypothetical protein AUCHE_21_00500 [Austwickia chelonae NBRC 105200]SEW37385.1 putative membrane protein [Austwickia chelonae]
MSGEVREGKVHRRPAVEAAVGGSSAVEAPAVAPEAPVADGQDTPWKRPAMRRMALLPLSNVTDWLFPALPVVFLAWSKGGAMLWLLLALPFLLLGLGGLSIFFTRYRIHEGKFLLRKGIVNKQIATVPLERIRTIDVTAPLLNQILGIADVSIRTGGAATTTLKGVKTAHARELRLTLLAGREKAIGQAETEAEAVDDPVVAPEPSPPEGTTLCRLERKWILLAPFSLSGFGALAAGYYFGQKVMEEERLARFLSPWLESAREGTLRIDPVALWVGGGAAVLVLAVALSMLLYVFAHWNYLLVRSPDGGLHITRGLTTSQATVIEESRMRGVVLERPMLLSLARGGRAKALVTGGAVPGKQIEDAMSGTTMLVPPAPLTVSRRVLVDVLGDPTPLEVAVTGHGPAATRRRWFRALSLPALGVPVLVVGWWRWGWPTWLFGVLAAVVVFQSWVAWLRARRLGHALVPGYLVADEGTMPFNRTVLRVPSIIGWQISESWFQRRQGLVTLSALMASGMGSVQVTDVPRAEAVRIIAAATPRTAAAYLTAGTSSSDTDGPPGHDEAPAAAGARTRDQ